jgi:hypothetical protein
MNHVLRAWPEIYGREVSFECLIYIFARLLTLTHD